MTKKTSVPIARDRVLLIVHPISADDMGGLYMSDQFIEDDAVNKELVAWEQGAVVIEDPAVIAVGSAYGNAACMLLKRVVMNAEKRGFHSEMLEASDVNIKNSIRKFVKSIGESANSIEFHVTGDWLSGFDSSSPIGKAIDVLKSTGCHAQLSDEAVKAQGRKAIRDNRSQKERDALGMISAAELGRAEEVEEFLDQGVHVDSVDDSGWAAIHMAAMEGNQEICELLIARGANVNLIAGEDGNALVLAARLNNIDLCETLLDAGASIKSRTSKRETVLHAAAEAGCDDLIPFFINLGVDINTKSSRKMTALDMAVDGIQDGDVSTILTLIAHGAKFNGKYSSFRIDNIDYGSYSPKMACAAAGSIGRLLEFMEKDAHNEPGDDSHQKLIEIAKLHHQDEVVAAMQAHMARASIQSISTIAAKSRPTQ